MDQLSNHLEKLLKYKNESPSRFYTCLADYSLDERDERYFVEIVIPKIYSLYSQKILHKDLVYLSLLANENHVILQKFLDYDKEVFVLNIEDAASLFDYYIYENKHWIYEIVNNASGYDKLISLKAIYSKLNMIKFISETNVYEVDIEQLQNLIHQIQVEYLDDFWRLYIEEIKEIVDSVYFCKELLQDNITDSQIFKFASTHSHLETLCNFIDFNDYNNWTIILDKLRSSKNFEELNVVTGFVIFSYLVKFLIEENLNDSANLMFGNVKTWLLELQDKKLLIELLESIFYLMFHKKHNVFTNKEKQVRFILFLLKSVIEDVKLRKTYTKGSTLHKRLTNLSNCVTDCLWRLELITNTKSSSKVEKRLLNYMMASPDSLIHICLKRGNYERAHQVIEIFDVRDSDLAREVTYAESFLKFRKFLRKNGKLKTGIDEFVEDFFLKQSSVDNNLENDLSELSESFNFLTLFECDNHNFMNIFDFALTTTKTWEESEIILNLAEKYRKLDDRKHCDYLNFYKSVVKLRHEIGYKVRVSLPEILVNPEYSLDADKYTLKKNFFQQLVNLYDLFQNQINGKELGIFNKNHPSHKTLLKMNELCLVYAQTFTTKEPIQYLLRVFNYLKAFSRILYIEQNSSDIVSQGKNSSFFDILDFNRSELTGKLLFEKELDPTEFEKYFGKLKLDFLYHVVGNCFPTINLHVQENVTIEELYHDNMLYTPSSSIIVYIQKRNWLLAFILAEMYKVEGVKIDISEVRLKTFFNYLRTPRIQHLKSVFDRNDIVASLQNCISAQKIKLYLREEIIDHDLLSIQSQNSNNSDGLETGEEILEDTKTTNWKTLYDIVESIPESQLKKKPDLIASRDNLLVNMIQDAFELDYYKYTRFISDRNVRIEVILNNFKKWPGKCALNIINAEICRFDCVVDAKTATLKDWLLHIQLNEELKDIFDLKSWYKSHNFCKDYSETAMVKILSIHNVNCLLNFIELYKPSENVLYKVSTNHLMKIMDSITDLPKIKKLLDALPFDHAIDICQDLLVTLKNLKHLQFVVEYLNNNAKNGTYLKNIEVSLKMLSHFAVHEQEHFFCLIREPLNILEVLLMNTKLDKLAAILSLKFEEYTDEVISVGKIDNLLRKYAEKSLDFRVITNPTPRVIKSPEPKLLQSFDSLSLASDKKQFVVPEAVPTKDEWVQNDEVVECMCCKQVIFSMFNRRHHCRRCGRVVCYSCSLKRMLVPTYGDIMVRVCSDCFNHTVGGPASEGTSDISSQSIGQEFWLLNSDPEHNTIIREEFSYEHAPSTSLCFSILKYHSKSPEYPKFLLEQCEVMLKLLQPVQEPTHEIDYLLVIKMLKSLAMAAKIASNETMLNSGVVMADRILSQAELLALLAERGCLNLMPLVGAQNVYIDVAVLRKLRDKLLQLEQWNLALEVSMKAGLDNTGVFAAWGKSCLKAGSLLLAREKLQRCLDKNSQYETSSVSRFSDLNRSMDSLTLGRSRFSSRISSSSTLSASENKPSKDPPLLHEIIQILETNTRKISPEVIKKMQTISITDSMSSLNQIFPFTVHADTAVSIANRIKNLKEVANGNFSFSEKKVVSYASRPSLDPIFYEECVYYLTHYGTHLSLIEFYIRHGDFQSALHYILENRLSSDPFIEMYMKCLKDGTATVLQEQMSLIDSSLDLWKGYLKQLCRHLENQQLLHCLYQLQLYIGDYVRAAMTCIRFYEENVTSFIELANNVGHLYKAEAHLKQILEQEQWVEVASVGKISETSKESFEERMLSNPDLVMKIDSKDVNKHINTVERQMEIVSFLASRESLGTSTRELLKHIISFTGTKIANKRTIPTLFGSTVDKINLAVMIILSGETVDQGFELATKIIEDFKLRPIKVYCLSGKIFAKCERYNGISQLVNCIKSTTNDSAISDMLDEILAQTVATLIKNNVTGTKVEDLIKLIKDKETKIAAYIEAKQLKTAYFLAVKYKRTADIRRIQREAELLNMPTIKALCQKVLQTPQHSKE